MLNALAVNKLSFHVISRTQLDLCNFLPRTWKSCKSHQTLPPHAGDWNYIQLCGKGRSSYKTMWACTLGCCCARSTRVYIASDFSCICQAHPDSLFCVVKVVKMYAWTDPAPHINMGSRGCNCTATITQVKLKILRTKSSYMYVHSAWTYVTFHE